MSWNCNEKKTNTSFCELLMKLTKKHALRRHKSEKSAQVKKIAISRLF